MLHFQTMSNLKNRRGGVFFLTLLLLLSTARPALTLPYRIAKLKVPPRSLIYIDQVLMPATPVQGGILIKLSPSVSFPFTLTVAGPLGGKVERLIASPAELQNFRVTQSLIKNPLANPPSLTHLPQICPRVEWADDGTAVYHAERDALNRTPTLQLNDPDAWEKKQFQVYTDMDGKNVLLLKSVRLTHDYEDTAIIDYVGPNPVNSRFEIVHEGEGGFYANLHYAVVPYASSILKFDRQTLLHFAQGKLREIDKNDLRPRLRTHSFIPGPFLSKSRYLYDLCEWGDTAYQARDQRLSYHDMALWDWDYPLWNSEHVLLIVWEGDEEDWLIQDHVIHPFHITDDVVGIFEIRRDQTLQPLTFRNAKGDFEITVQTGNLEGPLNQ